MDFLVGYRLECRIVEKRDTKSVGTHKRADFAAKAEKVAFICPKIENIILYLWWKVNFPQENI